MFQGQISARVGAFFRVAFPKTYKGRLGEKIIITYGFENSLIATSEKKWEELFKNEFESKSIFSEKIRDLKRIFLGGITQLDFDSQGRFIIPEYLRAYAKLTASNETVFVWQNDYVEIWDKKHWEENLNTKLKNLTIISEKLSREKSDERLS